jgi:hypothetical protein
LADIVVEQQNIVQDILGSGSEQISPITEWEMGLTPDEERAPQGGRRVTVFGLRFLLEFFFEEKLVRHQVAKGVTFETVLNPELPTHFQHVGVTYGDEGMVLFGEDFTPVADVLGFWSQDTTVRFAFSFLPFKEIQKRH